MYRLIRPCLFRLDAEFAHQQVLRSLHYLPAFLFPKPKMKPYECLGLRFPHRIGLAAGFDKNGMHLDALSKLGFAFIELGTVTPRPQPGNARPRLFRLPKAQAVINRMGFNNQGVDALVNHIKEARYRGILGINIGKNKDTPLTKAVEDYRYCLQKVYPYASYITLNISSPNTPDLRQLQQKDYFNHLIHTLKEERLRLSERVQRYVPLLIKISPDETENTLKEMAEAIIQSGLDGIIATNTTNTRYGVEALPYAQEAGGLSGAPLTERSTQCLRWIKEIVGNDVTLIASGGIDNIETVREKIGAGATLLQIYTGLIYQGPGLVKRLVEYM